MLGNALKKLFLDKNNKEISRNVLLTFAIKGLAMLMSVVAVPAYVNYFGNDTVYGAWLTIAAVFTWINMFDFGIGNGLRNCLVESIAAKDDESSKKYISSAYLSIGAISLVFMLIGISVSFFIPWNRVLKVSEELIAVDVFGRFIRVVFCGVVIHFFLMLINSVFYALQKPFLPNLLSLITQGMILVYILIPNGGSLNDKLSELALVYILSYNIPFVIATGVLFGTCLRNVKPSIRCYDSAASKRVLKLGGIFFVIQIALIALNSSNEVYINAFFTPVDVAQYNYYHKLFYIVTVFVALLAQPIWSAITKAYYEKRYHWIMHAWKILAKVAVLSAFGCVLLALLYQPIADIWLGRGKLTVETLPVTLFAVMTIQMTVVNLSNCISNGLGKIKLQAVFTVLGAVLKLLFTGLLAYIMNAWYAVILATIFASVPIMLVQPIYIYRLVKGLEGSEEKK